MNDHDENKLNFESESSHITGLVWFVTEIKLSRN